MVITKYALIDAPLKNGMQGGAFDPSALSYALQDDLACIIFDSEKDAVDAILKSGFSAHTYIAPLKIEVTEIRQVALSLNSVFDC